jgi:hypothetical protein
MFRPTIYEQLNHTNYRSSEALSVESTVIDPKTFFESPTVIEKRTGLSGVPIMDFKS